MLLKQSSRKPMKYSSKPTNRLKSFTLEGGSWRAVLPFLMPAFIFVFVVLIFPALYSLYASFFKWPLNDASSREFIGLKNYVTLFKDPESGTHCDSNVVLSLLLYQLNSCWVLQQRYSSIENSLVVALYEAYFFFRYSFYR